MNGTETDVTARIDALDLELDDLHDRIGTCRQAMVLSRTAIGLGLAICLITLTFATAYSTAPVILAAFTAIIAGVVWLGANKSTKDELEARKAALETEKTTLFDRIAVRNGWSVGAVQTYH